MSDTIMIVGTIVSGCGQAAYFTQLDWVQEQCLRKIGFKPFPGTLNLEISEDTIALIQELLDKDGLELISPDSNFCSGKVVSVSIRGIPCAIIAPAEEVRIHGKNILEVVSKAKLKRALKVQVGDTVDITINSPDPAKIDA